MVECIVVMFSILLRRCCDCLVQSRSQRTSLERERALLNQRSFVQAGLAIVSST